MALPLIALRARSANINNMSVTSNTDNTGT